MKDTIELIIDGNKVESIYQDGLADLLDAEEVQVCRASNVEWEIVPATQADLHAGWVVRAAHRPALAIRSKDSARYPEELVVSDDYTLYLAVFPTREEALKEEVKHFWELIQGRNLNG